MLKLPHIPKPEGFVGLYAYDFGDHVSVGYTASEVRVLRESDAHRSGTAYQIYRVDERGCIELRGVLDDRLSATEAMCFLYRDAVKARTDYELLRDAATQSPVPCLAELLVARMYGFDPPDVVALTYPASSSLAMGNWLGRLGFQGGDRVMAGIDVYGTLTGSDGLRIESCTLPSLIDYRDRTADEVLGSVDKPLQR